MNTRKTSLEYLDPLEDMIPNYSERRSAQVLEDYDLQSVLSMNHISDLEAVVTLFEMGIIGLPEYDTEEDEEEPDLFGAIED